MNLQDKVKQEQLQSLTDMWAEYKKQENYFKEKRLQIEKEAEAFLADKLEVKGTYTADTDLQVTTGEDEKWDKKAVSVLKHKFDNGELNDLPYFPFDIEYKANNAKMKLLKDDDSKLFFKVFGEALTTKPKKASFKMKK